MSRRNAGDGSVGRCRPPTHSQFKPGQSGNPRGRPKRSKNMATLFEEELNLTVAITENGKRSRISKRELIVKQVVNNAASPKCDTRTLLAIAKLLLLGAAAAAPAATAPDTVLGGQEDQELLRLFLERLKDETNEPA